MSSLKGALQLGRGDTVIVPKLDCFSRNAWDALCVIRHFREHGIGLHILDLGGHVMSDNGYGKLILTILLAVAEQERENTCIRTRATKADQRERGMFLGGRVPFGYDGGGHGRVR